MIYIYIYHIYIYTYDYIYIYMIIYMCVPTKILNICIYIYNVYIPNKSPFVYPKNKSQFLETL